ADGGDSRARRHLPGRVLVQAARGRARMVVPGADRRGTSLRQRARYDVTREENAVVVVLEDHQRWVGTMRTDSSFHRTYGDGATLEHIATAARLPRRAARRALARLVDAGRVTLTEKLGGTRYRLAGRDTGIVSSEQHGRR